MSASDVIGRIQEIRTTLTQMAAPIQTTAPAVTAANTAASTARAETFASVVSAVTSGTPVPVPVPTPAVSTPSAAPAGGIDFEAVSAKYVGLPYIWGGNDASAGLDCSSFVQNVYRDLGYELPRTTWDQINQGTPVASMAEARPGDLLFSHDSGHVAIYLGNGKAIDAPQPGTTIQVRDAWENDGNLTAIRRIIPEQVQNINQATGTASAQSAFLAAASL